jgi:cysteine desulfurase/selenocysteine lyase
MPDEAFIRREFPQDESLIYLNHAAVAPWPARTAHAVQAFAEENARSGARDYGRWLEREQALREQCRRLIHAPSSEDIAFLKNTSEGLSVVAEGLPFQDGDNVVTSDEEFPSNRLPWAAQARRGVTLHEVSLKTDDPEAALLAACDERTRVLTVSSVQFASGLRLDLPRLGEFCRERGIVFCVDAIQSLGAHAVDVEAARIDCLAADAHKWLLGPEGIALFFCRPELRERLSLHQFGWHMIRDSGDFASRDATPAASARRFECGSSNMLGIHALAASLSLFEEVGMAAIEAGVLSNTARLMDGLEQIPGAVILSRREAGRRAGILVFSIEGRDSAGLHGELVKHNVLCASRGGGIRLSPHFYTPRHKLDKAIEVIKASI